MPAVARQGDGSDHGGHITTGSSNVHVNGLSAARVGDMHSCPRRGHGVTAIISTPNAHENVATVGAICGCGAIITGGSSNVFAEGG